MKKSLPARIFQFYIQGFRSMGVLGRTLWIIILLKLFIMFGILRPFFFTRHLQGDDAQKAEQVQEHLINRVPQP